MMKDPAAAPISKGLLKLARQINAAAKPAYVPVEPEAECQRGKCFENVAAVVRRQGGSVQHGWRMREQTSAYVEGAFHAVWCRPDGSLIDVTPRADDLTQIVFLPDARMVWDGEDIEPRRMMLHEQPCYCGSGMPYKICHGLADD